MFKQLQLILTQLMIMHSMSNSPILGFKQFAQHMHATSDSPILGFKQFAQHICSVLFAMNFSGSKF